MSVISKISVFVVVLVALLSLCQSVSGTIIITLKEEQCLEKTGILFEEAGGELNDARAEFTAAMEMTMTSAQKMSAKYPEDQLRSYESLCEKYGGKMHIIKIDFFDCLLHGQNDDIELTLKNFANCMADVDDCVGFGQEHLLEEAWAELGLNCLLEEEETKKDPPSDDDIDVNKDVVKKEKEAVAKGEDEVDTEEKNSEYVPKEEQGKDGKKKKKSGGFLKFVLFCSLCGVGYFVFDRHRRGLPIELPYAVSSRLPFGGGGSDRFSRRPQVGFVSDYNLISGAEDNTLQLSSNFQ